MLCIKIDKFSFVKVSSARTSCATSPTYDLLPVVGPRGVVEAVGPEPELRVAVNGVAQDGGRVQLLDVVLDGQSLELREGLFTAEHIRARAEGDAGF